jgi:hypothetical protein
MQILDGKGKGYRAQVNDQGKLEVNSIAGTRESYICGNFGRSYVISTFVKTLNSTNEHFVLWFKNISQTYDMRLWVINFAWNGGSTNHNRALKWSYYIGTGAPTANYEEITSGNINFKSNNEAEVLVYRWDGVGDGMQMSSSGALATEEIFAQGNSKILLEGIPVVGYNDILAFAVTGEEIGDAGITLRYIMEEKVGL